MGVCEAKDCLILICRLVPLFIFFGSFWIEDLKSHCD